MTRYGYERRNRSWYLLGCLFCLITMGYGLTAHAVVNPEVLREARRSQATEWLTVDINATWVTETDGQVVQVVAAATVVDVTRTATMLGPGDIILIVYWLDPNAAQRNADLALRNKLPGPGIDALPPLIEAGKQYHAYLSAVSDSDFAGRVYAPGAVTFSFE